jgi:hypothetical protein
MPLPKLSSASLKVERLLALVVLAIIVLLTFAKFGPAVISGLLR